MLCSNCEYLYHPEYESSYTSCRVFGDEIPEKYERKDGEGCICNRRQLKKMFEEDERAWMQEATLFIEWYEKEGKNNG